VDGAILVATIVQWSELLQTIVASILTGIGVTFAYSLAIWGFGRSIERSREDRTLAAGSAAVVGVAAMLVVLAAVVIAIVVMASK
jgi:hypothetical protein